MRLWSLGLLALVLIGVLIAIGQSGMFNAITSRQDRLGDPLFADYERGSIAFIDADGRGVFVAQSHPDHPQILSGLPSYASKLFRLPIDSRPLSGSYQLTMHIDAARGAEGAIRVTINGVKRADVVIGQGRHRRKLKIELTPAELSARQLDVRLALIGRGPITECTPNEAIAAVATVQPESGLHLRLDKPLATTRDRLALWGDLVPVQWSGKDGKDGAADTATLIAAAQLAEKNYAVYFGNSGHSGKGLADLVRAATARWDVERPFAYPISLLSVPENVGARRFDRETSWRFRYDAAQLPGGELPSALTLRTLMGPLQHTRTTMFVTLNGHLIHARALGDDEEQTNASHVNASIALPAASQLERNTLEITLVARDEDDLRCGSQRLIAAELLPETVLVGEGERLVSSVDPLRALLADASPVALLADPMTAPDAQTAALLIARLRPSAIAFGSGTPKATIRILTGDIAAALAKLRPIGREWLVHFPDDRREGVAVEPRAAQARALVAPVALLVTLPQRTLAPPVPTAQPTRAPVAAATP